jgi:putative tryptophan/tyrosine transport system substrate-binding protein
MMHGHEKSRSAIVAVKPTNKAERTAAEPVERRAETKGSVDQQRTRRTQRRISVSKMLARIRQHIAAVDTQGGNRMRESCTYGSVRGARGNSRPYRDRREFITLLGGAAAAWPLATWAQDNRMRRIGVLMNLASDDAEGQARLAAFHQGLQQLGWTVGRNVQIDYRWGAGDADRIRKFAAELVALAPDVILSTGSPSAAALQQATRTVPIVFVTVVDPVSSGFVDSLARPGGNITGFSLYEYSISGKWLELLKEIAPGITRAAVIRDPALTAGGGQLGVIQAVAPSVGAEVIPVNVRDAGEIERAITAFARSPNGGLIVTGSTLAAIHRDLIVTLAARHKLPAVYFQRYFVVAGGLISYGSGLVDQYRDAAGYVDRILKGEKPADLPVQAPTKYELVINLKTAKTLGLEVPHTLLARADEVIEQ